MSKISLEGNASGTGTFTIAAPNTNTNYTITLPQSSGTLATTTTAGFEAGTVMLFAQTAAPTGWTKNTSTGDNSALRIVTGSASTGGSVDFTTAFSATRAVTISSLTGSAGATTLTTPQIPSHSHPGGGSTVGWSPQPGCMFPGGLNSVASTGATGGGGSHTHPLTVSGGSGEVNLAVKYVDVIRATKD